MSWPKAAKPLANILGSLIVTMLLTMAENAGALKFNYLEETRDNIVTQMEIQPQDRRHVLDQLEIKRGPPVKMRSPNPAIFLEGYIEFSNSLTNRLWKVAKDKLRPKHLTKFLNDLYVVDYSIARKNMIHKDYEGKDEALKRLIDILNHYNLLKYADMLGKETKSEL